MKFYRRSFIFYLIWFFAASLGFAQSAAIKLLNGTASLPPEIIGIWENDMMIVSLASPDLQDRAGAKAEMVLKPFYRYYYDGFYLLDPSFVDLSFALVDGDIYLQYWESASVLQKKIKDKASIEILPADDFIPAGGSFWRPAGNRTELSIDPAAIQRKLRAYYITNDFTDPPDIYEIPYWIADLDYSDEKAELVIKGSGGEKLSLFVDKYIKIGSLVYTCAVGRRKEIRNPIHSSVLAAVIHISEDKKLMVLSPPYLVRSKITDLRQAILDHNAIVYPPHDGRAHFAEPAIYKKLETMTIE